MISSLPRSEGTTTTALEAQSCGVPVVATRVAAVAEAVADGVTGLLVPPEQPRVMADAVLRLLGDERLREWMGAAGRKAAFERFDAVRVADIYVMAYEAALAHRATRQSAA